MPRSKPKNGTPPAIFRAGAMMVFPNSHIAQSFALDVLIWDNLWQF